MINFYDLGPVKLFDGDIESQVTPLFFNIQNLKISVPLLVLNRLDKLAEEDDVKRELNAEDIALALSFEIIKLGPVKIFNGSQPGLKLYYYIVSGLLCIFSLGEYQAGRFLCIYEASIKL